jgi:hypothetical protein
MIDAAISSTGRIAAFFGIAPEERKRTVAKVERRAASSARPTSIARRASPRRPPASGVQAVIEDALRAAGLMR